MNILTIDFDWTMRDCIGCYNEYISGPNPIEMWEFLPDRLPDVNFNLNMQLFQQIQLICDKFSDRLYSIINHQDVVSLITEPIDTLINIDHHHDCYPIDLQEQYHAGNWVLYLNYLRSFKNYIWIANETSWGRNIFEDVDYMKCIITSSPLKIINEYEIDKCILCESPEWLPPTVRDFYHQWISTLNFCN